MLTLHGNIFLPRNAPFVREIGISFILETPAPKALYPRSVEILTGIGPPSEWPSRPNYCMMSALIPNVGVEFCLSKGFSIRDMFIKYI